MHHRLLGLCIITFFLLPGVVLHLFPKPTTLRFVTESLASKILNIQVLMGELDALELTI